MAAEVTTSHASLAEMAATHVQAWWRRVDRELKWVAVAISVFLVVTIWWLTQDGRVQDWDNALHTVNAFNVHDQLAIHNWLWPFKIWVGGGYPFFAYLIGALGVAIGGYHEASTIMASNLVFMPLLAISCYGVGKLAYGTPRAGLLAAIFALGTPMIVSEFHEYLLDPQQAAMVAATVWGLLACQRFERLGVAAAAGLAAGLAMLIKQTSLLFLLGVIAVMVIRGGGWRTRRSFVGAALFAGVFAAIALPWYIYHYQDLNALYHLNQSQTIAPGLPPRWSLSAFVWYFWDAVNIQLLLPLAMFTAIGVALVLIRLYRTRWRWNDTLFPELLAGALVSYLGCIYIVHKDPRYSLPALVYMAVFGGGWVAVAGPRVRRWGVVALIIFAVVNLVQISTGDGPNVRIPILPNAYTGAEELHRREVTLFTNVGWLRSSPGTDGDLPSLMSGLKKAGITNVIFDQGTSDAEDFNTLGLEVLALGADLYQNPVYNPGALSPHEAYLIRHVQQPGEPRPCRMMDDGTGVYAVVGDTAVKPWDHLQFICPGRAPLYYGDGAPGGRPTPVPVATAATATTVTTTASVATTPATPAGKRSAVLGHAKTTLAPTKGATAKK
jgi:hypothetical protein